MKFDHFRNMGTGVSNSSRPDTPTKIDDENFLIQSLGKQNRILSCAILENGIVFHHTWRDSRDNILHFPL